LLDHHCLTVHPEMACGAEKIATEIEHCRQFCSLCPPV
jgi:hypothetical protein